MLIVVAFLTPFPLLPLAVAVLVQPADTDDVVAKYGLDDYDNDEEKGGVAMTGAGMGNGPVFHYSLNFS